MLVVRMGGVACVVPEEDYNRIILLQRENISSGKMQKWLKMEGYYAYKGTKCIFS